MVGITVYQRLSVMGINHTIVQYPFWALIPLLTLLATRTRGQYHALWWILLAIVCATSLYVKYSMVISFMAVVIWMMYYRDGHHHFRTLYPYVALVVFLWLASPVLIKMLTQADDIIAHANYTRQHGGKNFFSLFISVALATPLWMYLMALWAGLLSWHLRFIFPFHGMSKEHSVFIVIFAFVPFVATLFVTALLEIPMNSYWVTPMVALWGLLLVAATAHRWHEGCLKRILIGAVVLLLANASYYFIRYEFYPQGSPHEDIAQQAMTEWKAETNGAPLHHVVGSIGGIASIVALLNPDRPTFHDHHDPQLPPIVTDEGALFIWRIKGKTSHPHKSAPAKAPTQITLPNGTPTDIYYIIQSPQ